MRIVPAAEALSAGFGSASVSLVATIVGVSILFTQHRKIEGTTMSAPWCWAIVSLLSIGLCEAVIGFRGTTFRDTTIETLRFMAAVSVFCPVMAVLGAKRPQNVAWQLVVVTLWGILAMPAAMHLLLHPERSFSIHPVQSWFLLLLGLLAYCNIVPTRLWLAGTLLLAAGWLLLASHLPLANASLGALGPTVGLGLAVLAIVLTAAGLPRRRRPVTPLDRVWLDFRDTFGALWALRVAERINAAAKMYDWDIDLSWRGFRGADAGDKVDAADTPAAFQTTLHNLLRRFVSDQWIASRLGERID